MKRIETLDEIVDTYFASSGPTRSKVYMIFGIIFVLFAIVGVWIPGWPTVSWAVPAAFLFSLSSERLFRWSLTNDYFGSALFEYYATGKTLPRHVKTIISSFILITSTSSAYFVWYVSTRGEGELLAPSTWDGADPGFGAATILLVGLIGIWYVTFRVRSR